MITIPLMKMISGARNYPHTQKNVKVGETIVDDVDADLAKHRWGVRKHKRKDGSLLFYAQSRENGSRIILHRVIAARMGFICEVDHIDGNSLNNQRSNLRPATRHQNLANMRKRVGTSRFKGVSWSKRDKKWRAQINAHKSKFHLGFSDIEEDAARAYDAKARELFGPYAKVNFP